MPNSDKGLDAMLGTDEKTYAVFEYLMQITHSGNRPKEIMWKGL